MFIQANNAPPAINLLPSEDGDSNELARQREIKHLRARVGTLEVALDDARKVAAGALHGALAIPNDAHRSCAYHMQVSVSLTTPSVTCSECGAELSPLDVLRDFAKRERHFVMLSNDLRQEQSKLRTEIDTLKKQRASLKAQVRDYEKRVADRK